MKKKRTIKSAVRTKKRTTAATRTKKRVLKAATTAVKRRGPVTVSRRRSPVTVSSRRHVSTARNHRYHSPSTTQRTSRSHIGSIIKGIILFLGVVLLLAILASIFMPSARHYIPDTLNQTGTMRTQPAQRLAPRNFDRSYVTPEVNNNQGSVSSESAPADQY